MKTATPDDEQPVALDPTLVLTMIASKSCERDRSGPGSCFRDGRTVAAKYEDDAVCDPCLAWAALHGR